MIQPTSQEAYNQVKPLITRKQYEIMQMLEKECWNNWTNMEIAYKTGWSINRVTPRTLELRKMGILKLYSRRKYKRTRNSAMAWCIT